MPSPISRRRFLRAAGLAGAVLLGGGATLLLRLRRRRRRQLDQRAGGGEGDFGELAVQLSWIKNIEFAGNYVADSKGYYTDAGFSSVNLIAGPGDAIAPLVAGDVLYSFGGSETVANAVLNNDAPLKIIGANFQKNPFCILYLADDPIPDPEAHEGQDDRRAAGQRADLAGAAAHQRPRGGRRPRPGQQGPGRLRADAARERRGAGLLQLHHQRAQHPAGQGPRGRHAQPVRRRHHAVPAALRGHRGDAGDQPRPAGRGHAGRVEGLAARHRRQPAGHRPHAQRVRRRPRPRPRVAGAGDHRRRSSCRSRRPPRPTASSTWARRTSRTTSRCSATSACEVSDDLYTNEILDEVYADGITLYTA